MKAGFRMIDSDLHVQEATVEHNFLEPYLEEPYRGRTKIYNQPLEGGVTWITIELDGTRYRRGTRLGGIQKLKVRKPPVWAHHDIDAGGLLAGMDVEGLDIGVVFPTYGLSLAGECFESVSPDFGNALARAYNTWMRDFCSANPARLKPSAIINFNDPVGAAAEARRAVEELGAVGIFASCNSLHRRQFHAPFFDPLWAELNRLQVPVCFHPAGAHNEQLPRLNSAPHSDTISHALTNPVNNMMNAASFTAGGIFERFPNLKAAFLETSATWLLWLLWRLDDELEWFGPGEESLVPLSMKPSEYFRRQGWVACEPDEEPLRYLVDYLGPERIVISSDFPHPNSYYPEAMNKFIGLEGIDKTAKQKILWDNPCRLYDLDVQTGESRFEKRTKVAV
jgi:uncharacterized protein